jgi:hypothetical protein
LARGSAPAIRTDAHAKTISVAATYVRRLVCMCGLWLASVTQSLDGARPQGREFATNFGEFGFDLKSLAIRDSAPELFA